MKKPILIFTLFAVTLLSLLVFSACSDTGFRHVDFQEFEVTLIIQDPTTGEFNTKIVTTNHRQIDPPAPEEKLGCVFDGWYILEGSLNGEPLLGAKWDKDFPVKKSGLVLFAKHSVRPEMEPFEFVSTADTCTITGVKNSSITSITIPKFVTDIKFKWDQNAFYIQSIDFEQGICLKTISENAFIECENLRSITLPDGLETIGKNAFNDCHRLSFIRIPSSVKRIEDGAFSNSGLNKVIFEDGIQLEHLGASVFNTCQRLQEITLPEGTKSIPGGSFGYCRELKRINIPSSVTSIGSYAFIDCIKLETINFADNSQLERIDELAFSSCVKLQSINLPAGLEHIERYAFGWCSSLVEITIPGTVQSIKEYTFHSCVSLQSVVFEEGVLYVLTNVFSECTSLESISFPSTLIGVLESSLLFDHDVDEITYNGTIASWQSVARDEDISAYYSVVCTDGTYTVSPE